ncbi:DUF6079 family protein [Micropruina sonneratiae]|uniref:DUF6079 family protein n=1 Tax=Micropruina sonneratiae TaxID=2986940 RepID=UPI00222762A8|nr:DUF6079 family protein [Micropruina sp. KQZ13P-5]MCW3158006.1 DUF6079 family protein [Micropruina sp. KQZ13P-5]MCW3158572.1 DUF6079 family protein [Micropruina sp. KQZ13P-5]
MSALLRDIFTIPETTSTADYVLRLTESVDEAHLARTIDEYVVTSELSRAFDTALAVVADAIGSNTSKGAFLTGSFGSGKSHFMAVLYALLEQYPPARAIPELAETVARHDPELQGRRVLPLTFHLLGATSLEQALFDGYLRQVRQLHPDAPLPLLHQTARLLEDADALRARMGDDAFFAGLNEGSGEADVWGAVLGGGGTWTADTYASAQAAALDDPRRAELVNALQQRYFTAYTRHAAYVGLDEGLTAISTHAQSLGYDAVVLFLDELVLWLAFRIRDRAFFGAETQKITKLVEGGQGGRPVPLISFIARQMDLRRWLADSGASGAEQQALDQAFRYQEGRFREIRLGDDNLPYVANKRLLTPRNAEAKAEIDRAFERLDRRAESWDVLLDGVNTDDRHRGADAAQFRLTYPFSPALVSTLRSLAGVMQRERTALKVMQQMLVDRRDTLTIDDVIPVGDAFDYLVTGGAGDQPLDEASAALFRAAHTLFRERLQPMILKESGVSAADLDDEASLPPTLSSELRLAKTLLLSAVAPNVPALKALTAGRLAALNHGSIRSPLPGGEAAVVMSKLRLWAAQVPEIRVEATGRNPLVSVQLSDVDYESVVERARGEDNDGRRRDLIKRLVADAFGVERLGDQDMLGAYTHRLIWRGSWREVDLVFGNVRDAGWLTDDHFRARPGTWRFVIDHPFDEPGHSTSEDFSRIDGFRAHNWNERTIVWLPRFFSEARLRDVSRLVILNYLFDGTGERYANYADHLSETGRVQARAILQSQRDALLHTVQRAIQVAYDVESPTGGDDVVMDAAHPEVYSSLTPSFTPRPPAGGTLKQAFVRLVADAFSATFPGHPRFEPSDVEVRVRELQATYTAVEQALADKENRVPLGPDAATVRRIANPLGVGKAAETHFLMGDDYFSAWGPEFERRLGARGGDENDPVTVSEVRGWINAMEPAKGLAESVGDLVILAWAALRRRAWFAHGAPIPTPKPGTLRNEMELRVQAMPDGATWTAATHLAGVVFGLTASVYVTPAEVANLADKLREEALKLSDPAHRLVSAVELARTRLALTASPETGRLQTARQGAELCEALRGLNGLRLIQRLAAAHFAEPSRVGRSLASAATVAGQLTGFSWNRLDPLLTASRQQGPRADEASRILGRLRGAVLDDEFVTPVAPALKRAEDDLFAWLAEPTPPPGPTPPSPDPVPPRRPGGTRRIRRGQGAEAVVADLNRFVAEHPDDDIIVEWRTE